MRSFFRAYYSYLLYLTLLSYFCVYFLIDVIYVVWTAKSLKYIFLFNFFWAAHMLIFSIPSNLILEFVQISDNAKLKIKSIVACFFTVLLTFPNFLFYELYQGPPSFTVTTQATDLNFLKTVAPFFYDFKNIMVYFLIPTLITIGFYFVFVKFTSKSMRWMKILSLVIIVAIAAGTKELADGGKKGRKYIPEHNPYHPLYYMYVANTIPFKIKRHSLGQLAKAKIEKDDLEKAKKFLNEHSVKLRRHFDSSNLVVTKISKQLGIPRGIKPNIIFLVMESLSTFHMRSDTMPFLTNFGKEYPQTVIFNNAFAVSDQTVKGQHALFCGQYTTVLGKISTDYPDLKIECLSHILKEKRGYSFNAFNGVGSKFHNKHHYFLEVLGFDTMDGVGTMPKDFFVKADWGTSDFSALKYSLHLMKKYRRPYAFQLMSVNFHGPYLLPPDSKELPLDQKLLEELPVSHQILHYDDAALRYFFEKSKELPDYKNTIFILTADTGGGQSRQKEHSAFELFLIRNHIPLIIFSPLFYKLKKPLVVDDFITQYSVAPLLLDLMGEKFDNSFIGIPRPFYDDPAGDQNSYVRSQVPMIGQVFNMQFSYLERNALLVFGGISRKFVTPASMKQKSFDSTIKGRLKREFDGNFRSANKFWSKVYMPLLHFNQLPR